MATTLTRPAEVPSGSPVAPRGILALASPAPEGWEQGGLQVSVTCPSPIIRDKCITIPDGDEPGRPSVEAFPAFMIEQGSACSTLSGAGRADEARNALMASTDYALGLTLMNGEANDFAPSLSDATDLGAATDVVQAVALLESAAAMAGSGQPYALHASPAAAAYLASAGLVDDAGRSPSGTPWIISSGYAQEQGEPLRIWATGRVWAAAGAIDVNEAIDRRTNNREAWAIRSAIVGFNTCINLTTTFPATTGGAGMPGASAYEVAVANGFEGTEAEWLESLIGAPGTPGTNATVTVGDVTTGAPGSAATVTNSGTASDAVLDFSIPEGDAGDPGTPGTNGTDGDDGVVQAVVAGTGVTVDDADPANPIINIT